LKAEAAVEESCICMWEQPRPQIWRCEACHTYRLGNQQLVGVTSVSKDVMGESYHGVDKIVLEIARVRGVLVDLYFSEWLIPQAGSDLPSLEDLPAMIEEDFPECYSDGRRVDRKRLANDTAHRADLLINWWLSKNWKAASVHRILYSERDGVAGETDFETESTILDLKVVANLLPSYELQLGGYLDLDGREREVAVIHVNDARVRFVPYDAVRAKTRWRGALIWYWIKQAILHGR
jgi:hypothetical protein